MTNQNDPNASFWPVPRKVREMGALGGIKVIDLSVAGPGPFATLVLASYGADVIHVSRTGALDPTTDSSHQNCGKRSIRIDLKSAEGKEILCRLATGADVLVEGFRPGVMERLGIGPAVLMALNPALLYVRLTGWGQTGPYSKMPGHDINYLAITGALSVIGRDEPTPPLGLLGDFSGGGLMAVINILAAIRNRDQTGCGQVIDTNVADGVAMLMHSTLSAAPRGEGLSVVTMLNGSAPFYRAYQCSDGRWFSIGAIEPKFYLNLLRALDLADDTLMLRQYDMAAWPAIRLRFAARFAERTRDEWAAKLLNAEACAFPVLQPGETADDPHLAARGTVARQNGRIHVARAGRFGDDSATPLDPACMAGADTFDVLAGLGYDADTITTFEQLDVVAGGADLSANCAG